MVVGILTSSLLIPGSESLKDRRRVTKSLCDRIRSRFNVSCADVSDHELWQRATLAVACVNTDRQFAERILNQIMDLIDAQGDAEIANTEIEFV